MTNITRLTRWIQLLTPPEYPWLLVGFLLLIYLPVKCIVNYCLLFSPFCFGHCIVCPCTKYGFLLPLLYVKIRHNDENNFSLRLDTTDHTYNKLFPIRHCCNVYITANESGGFCEHGPLIFDHSLNSGYQRPSWL